MVKRGSKGASQKAVDEIEAKLDDASHGLAALKTLIDDVEGKLDDAAHGLAALKTLIDAVEGKLDDPAHGLANLKTLIDALEAKLDHASYGLIALKGLIDAVEAKLDAWPAERGTDNAELEADAAIRYAALVAYVDEIETLLKNASYGLANLKTLIDAVEAKLDVPANYMADVSALALEATLATHDTDIKALIAALNDLSDAEVWTYATRTLTPHAFPFTNPGAALDVTNIRTAAYARLGAPVGASISADIAAVEAKLDVPANFMADVSALALEATLATHDTDIKALLATVAGYIDTEIAAIETKLDSPANFMADVSALALEATLATHDTDIKALIAALNDLSDVEVWTYVTRTLTSHAFPFTNPGAALDVSNIRTAAYPLLIHGTYGLAALDTDLNKLLTGIIQGTGTVLPANKSLYDLLWLDRYLDEQDSFLWDTSAFTTVEQDISALFTTPLTGTKRRKYWLYLDMTGPAGDAAAWATCTVKVKLKIDGANYRTISKAEKSKTDLGATEEPGIPIEIPSTAKDIQVTMQFDVALAGDHTIYYEWVQEKMEY